MRPRTLFLALLIGITGFQMAEARDPRVQNRKVATAKMKPARSYQHAGKPKKVKFKKIKAKKFKRSKNHI